MHDTTTMRPPSEPTPGTEDEPLAAAPSSAAAGASLTVACVLLGAVVVGGLILRLAPGQNSLDSWGFTLLPGILQSTFFKTVTDLGLAPVAGVLGLTAAALAWRRHRLRALACLAGPALAVLLSELLKVLVGRRLEHVLCYPSGTAAVVTAVAGAFVLVSRGPGRVLAVVVGSVAVILEAVAVVKLRWHYPSDTLAGIALGAGSLMLADAVLHRLGRRPSLRRRR
jgi:membrane-associated phospholipid phosphatase